MPYLRMQRLGICGPAVRQRPRHLPRYETALPQDLLLASVVHKRIVPYHAAEDIAPWVWSGYPPPHERGWSPMTQNPSHPALGRRCFSGSHAHRKPLAQTPSFVPRRNVWECPSHAPLVDCGVLRYTWSRAVTTGPNTRVEVSVLGRLDMFLTTREPPSCFAGAPTSVWHRSRPSQGLSQRLSRDTTAK